MGQTLPGPGYHENTPTRRKLDPETKDRVVSALPKLLGRWRQYLPSGECAAPFSHSQRRGSWKRQNF